MIIIVLKGVGCLPFDFYFIFSFFFDCITVVPPRNFVSYNFSLLPTKKEKKLQDGYFLWVELEMHAVNSGIKGAASILVLRVGLNLEKCIKD